MPDSLTYSDSYMSHWQRNSSAPGRGGTCVHARQSSLTGKMYRHVWIYV